MGRKKGLFGEIQTTKAISWGGGAKRIAKGGESLASFKEVCCIGMDWNNIGVGVLGQNRLGTRMGTLLCYRFV